MLASINHGDIQATFDLTQAWPSPVTVHQKGENLLRRSGFSPHNPVELATIPRFGL